MEEEGEINNANTSTSSAIFNLVPRVLLPDCWSWVTQTLGARLPPSWDTEVHVRISFSLCLRSTCERRLRLLCTSEPAFTLPGRKCTATEHRHPKLSDVVDKLCVILCVCVWLSTDHISNSEVNLVNLRKAAFIN